LLIPARCETRVNYFHIAVSLILFTIFRQESVGHSSSFCGRALAHFFSLPEKIKCSENVLSCSESSKSEENSQANSRRSSIAGSEAEHKVCLPKFTLLFSKNFLQHFRSKYLEVFWQRMNRIWTSVPDPVGSVIIWLYGSGS